MENANCLSEDGGSCSRLSEDDGYMSLNGRFPPPPPPREARRIIATLIPRVSPSNSTKRIGNGDKRGGQIQKQTSLTLQYEDRIDRNATIPTQTTIPKTKHARPFGWQFGDNLPNVPPRTVPSAPGGRHRDIVRSRNHRHIVQQHTLEEFSDDSLDEEASSNGVNIQDDLIISRESLTPPPCIVTPPPRGIAWEVPLDPGLYGPGSTKVIGRRSRRASTDRSSCGSRSGKETDEWPDPPTTEDGSVSPLFSDIPQYDSPHLSDLSSGGTYVIRKGRRRQRMPLPSEQASELLNNLLPPPPTAELKRTSTTFDNIKCLLREGLIEGLDEAPPDFTPPEPPPVLVRVVSLPAIPTSDSLGVQTRLDTPLEADEIDCNGKIRCDIGIQANGPQSLEEVGVMTSLTGVITDSDREREQSTTDSEGEGRKNRRSSRRGLNSGTDTSSNEALMRELRKEYDSKSIERPHSADGNKNCSISGPAITESGTDTSSNEALMRELRKEYDPESLNNNINNNIIIKKTSLIEIKAEEPKSSLDRNGPQVVQTAKLELSEESWLTASEISRVEVRPTEIIQNENSDINKIVNNNNSNSVNSINNVSNNNINNSSNSANSDNNSIGRTNSGVCPKEFRVKVEVVQHAPLPPSPVLEEPDELNSDYNHHNHHSSASQSTIEKKESFYRCSEPAASDPLGTKFRVEPSPVQQSTSSLKTRSMDAGFSRSHRSHYSSSSRRGEGSGERRTLPVDINASRRGRRTLGRSSTGRGGCHDEGGSLPETPIFARGCDIPRTPHRKAPGIPAPTYRPNTGSTVRLGEAMAGAELLRLAGGPGRGWYPRHRSSPRPASVENLDRLPGPPPGPWGHSDRKPQTLPPNLTPKFFQRSPREALRRVTSLLIRGNSKEKKDVPSNQGLSGDGSDGHVAAAPRQKRGFFRNWWKKSRHYSLEQP